VQQSGAGIRITIPGVTPDADGKSRAVMTLTVAEADPQGTRVDSRLNGRLMQQEWWRPTDQGVVVVQRGDGETNVTFDPPQILFPWPLGERSWQWTFAAGGQRFTPTSHLWGPLPMQGPRGPAAGYIVLTEQSRRVPVTDTASRQVKTDTLVEFIPGVGMVRQLFVNTADGEMTNRIEMTMTSEGSTAGGGQRAAKR